MKSFFVFSSIILITCEHNIIDEYKKHKNFKLLDPQNLDCGFSTATRIVGGHEAKLGQYPWIVRIGYSYYPNGETADFYDCGGSLITDLHVLTAAHCSGEFRNDGFNWVQVRVGEHDTSNSNTGQDCDKTGYCLPPPQDIPIASYFCHVQYEKKYKGDDICILRLAKPVTTSVSVQPICLPFPEKILKDDLALGKRLEVAGWGYNKPESKESSKVLLRLDVPAINNSKCSETFMLEGEQVTEKQICAGGVKGEDSCSGDSGGPLMKPYSLQAPPKYFLLGIVSYGSTQCGGDFPGVYTDVRQYLTWILNNLLEDQNIE